MARTKQAQRKITSGRFPQKQKRTASPTGISQPSKRIKSSPGGSSDSESGGLAEPGNGELVSRRRCTVDFTGSVDVSTLPNSDDAALPPLKKRSQQPSRSLSNVIDPSIKELDPSLLADHFAKAIKKHFSDSTSIELEEKYLPAKVFLNTTGFDKEHTAQNLPEYLEAITLGGKDELAKRVEVLGNPHTIIITPSGIRAADIARVLRRYQTDECKIAKLFAKHMKLKATVDYVNKTRIGFGVGTPTRLNDLLVSKALNVEGLKRIIVDGSFLDEKKRSIFDMGELFMPLVELLKQGVIKERLGQGEDSIALMVF